MKEVYKFSGDDASNYEEYLGPLLFESSAKELLSHIIKLPAHSILEIACGTGRLTRHLRANFPAATQQQGGVNEVQGTCGLAPTRGDRLFPKTPTWKTGKRKSACLF